MMRSRTLVLAAFLFAGMTLSSPVPRVVKAGENIRASQPLDPVQVWKQFRSAYPYLMQGIALQRGKNDECVLIVSEPPPQVTEADLRALLPGVSFQKHTIGADGWVKDAVVRLNITERRLRELVAELHQLMYSTSYKAYVLDLPAQPQLQQPRPKMDLKIASNDVTSWVLNGNDKGKPVRFRPLAGGEPVAFGEIAELHALAYHSEPAGLVGWWIPKNVSISDCAVPARQFAVDSDLVLGAVGNGRGVLILGRERLIPMELLPPLRFETIQLLGSVRKDELMQTINPQEVSCHVATNLIESWELNLLSRELYDTEFGTLLTIADVLLKSWTEHWLNNVRGFRDYPLPAKFPFAAPPITFGFDALVFNYDSEGAGHALEVAWDQSAFSMVRTGVLPISYFPGRGARERPKKLRDAEQIAYEWFAEQSDPPLVRVVQYTALLQAFRAFKVKSPPALPGNKDVVKEVRQGLLREMVEDQRYSKMDTVQSLAERMDQSPEIVWIRKVAEQALKEKKIDRARESQIKKYYSVEAFKRSLEKLRDLSKERKQDLIGALDGENPFLRSLVDDYGVLRLACKTLASVDRFDEKLAQRVSEQSTGWGHSPVLIYDHNEGGMALGTGGHNLKTRTPRFVLDPAVEQGKPPVAGRDGRYRINPADLPKLRIGQGEQPYLGTTPPARSMDATLEFKPESRIEPRPDFGWRRSSTALVGKEGDLAKKVRETRPTAVCVFGQEDGSYRIDNGRTVFEARTHQEASDVLLDMTFDKTLDVELIGTSADQADAIRTTLLGRNKGTERLIRTSVGRFPRKFAPLEFRPAEYKIDRFAIKSFQITQSGGKVEVELSPRQFGKPKTRVNFMIRASQRVLETLKDSLDLVRNLIARALRGSTTADEFHLRINQVFRDKLREALKLSDTEVEKLRIESEFPLRLQDQYMSKGGKAHGRTDLART